MNVYNQENHTEEKYIHGLVENDEAIISMIYKENFGVISNSICSNGGSESEAWDIFQDAIIIIYTKAKNQNLQLTSKFSTYLHAICRNLWLKQLRKKRQEVVMNADETEYKNSIAEDSINIESDKTMRHRLFRRKFEELGEACQKLLGLYFDKISMHEISKIMGYTSNFATQKAHRCRKELIASIKKDMLYKELID